MAQDFDPLAPYRAQGARPAAPVAKRPEGYRAFTVVSGGAKPARLDIRPKDGLAVARLYSSITEIAYDRQDYTGVLLVIPGKLVKIRGTGLKPLVDTLLAGTCSSITELDDGQHVEPGAAVIESIEILTPQAESTPRSKAAGA